MTKKKLMYIAASLLIISALIGGVSLLGFKYKSANIFAENKLEIRTSFLGLMFRLFQEAFK